MEEVLARLLDERALENLSQQFAQALDGGKVDDFLAVFTEDVDYRSGPRHYRGHGPLREFFLTRAKGGRVSRHLMSGLRLVFEGEDRATGQSQWLVFAGSMPEDGLPVPGTLPFLVADVRDIYLRIESGWRIAERHITPVFQNAAIAAPV